MKKAFYKILIVVIIFVILWAILFTIPYFNINNIQINGLDNLSEEQVKSMLTTEEGKNIFAFSTSKSENEIKKSHYVQEVKVSRDFPSTVVVDLNEYKLRGYVPYMGSYLYINEEGLILDIHFTVGEYLKVDNNNAFTTMVELSKLFDKYQLFTDIVRVDISNINDIHLYINKVDVAFGNMEDANRKLLMLVEVLKQLDTNYAGILNLTGDNASFEYLT